MSGRKGSGDKSLGVDRPIDRRDFLNGVAVAAGTIGAAGLPGAAEAWRQDETSYYPPILTGLRGSHAPRASLGFRSSIRTGPGAPIF